MKPLPELMFFVEGLPEPHILFDTQYRILAANAAYRRQFSPDRSVVGRTCFEVSFYFHFDKTSIIQGQLVIDWITSGVFSMANSPITKSSSSASRLGKTLL